MNRREIVNDIKAVTGKSWLRCTEIARYLGEDRHKMAEMMAGYPSIGDGQKKYFVNDVAAAIMDRRA